MKKLLIVSLLLFCFAAMGLAKSQYADHRPFESKILLAQDGQCPWCFPPSCTLLNNPTCWLDELNYERCLYYCHYPGFPNGWDQRQKEREIAPIIAYWRKRPDIVARLR